MNQSRPAIPLELMYEKVQRAISTRQTLQFVNANQSGTISSANGQQNILRVQLPSTEYLNCKQSYVQFKCKIVDDGGLVGGQFRNGIGGLFQAVRVFIGGTLVENCTDYHVLQRLLADIECDDAKLDSNWAQGMGTNASLLSWATADRHYVHKLRTGFFSQEKLVPLWALRGQVEVEFVFNSTNSACIYTGGACHYEVSEFRVICELHTLDQAYTASMTKALASEGIQILFPSFESLNQTLTSTNNDVEIKSSKQSVKSLLFCIRSATNLTDQASDWVFSLANLTSFNLKYGSQIYPNYDLQIGAPAHIELNKAVGKLQMIPESSQLTYATYVSSPSKAYLGLDLEKFLSQQNVSGADFMSNEVYLHTNHSAVPNNAQLTLFIVYDIILTITLSGVLVSY